jgi:hypothetical protein
LILTEANVKEVIEAVRQASTEFPHESMHDIKKEFERKDNKKLIYWCFLLDLGLY